MSKQEEILHKLSTDDRNYIKEKIKRLKEELEKITANYNELYKLVQRRDDEIETLSRKINRYENMFRGRAIKRTGDMQKDIEIHMNNIAIQQLRQVQEECFTQKELISTGQVAFFMVDIVDIMEIISQHIKELERV